MLLGWIASKVNGSHAWFIEGWKFDQGEIAIWRDDAADVAIIPKLGQAVSMSPWPRRFRRWPVIATNQRIIVANKTFTGRHMVRYVLYRGAAPDGESKHVLGGTLTRGYATLVIEPGMMTAPLDAKRRFPYIALIPVAGEPSSTNIAEIRIYSDSAASFHPPGSPRA